MRRTGRGSFIDMNRFIWRPSLHNLSKFPFILVYTIPWNHQYLNPVVGDLANGFVAAAGGFQED